MKTENEKKAESIVSMLCFFSLVGALAIGVATHWYRSSVQSNLWLREGAAVTTWDVFWGAKPIERTITIKDSSGGRK